MTARRAALVTLVTAAVLLLGTAGPASAADGLTVDITSPAEGAVLDGPDVIVKGTATTSGLYRMSGVSVRVTSVTNPGTFGCDRTCDGASGGHSATFSYGRRLDFNGPYTVTVTAYDTLPVVGGERSTPAQRHFKVEVPPAAPRDVKVEAGADRRVTISWVRNTEPDLRRYQVTRLAPGSSSGTVVANVSQPSSGSRVSTVDANVPPGGGAYRYVVTAVRPDRNGELSDRAVARSSPASVELVAAPTDAGGPPGTGGEGPGSGPGAGPAADGPAPTVTATGPRGANVSSLLSRTGGAPPALAIPGGVAIPVDDGFSTDLPLAVPGGDIEGEDSEWAADPAVLDDSSSVANERALFVPIAAGLLLCVLAFHVRQFDKTVLAGPPAGPPAYHPLGEDDPDGGGPHGGGDEAGAGARDDGKRRRRVLVGSAGPFDEESGL